MICTHNLAEAEELADQIAIIRHGKIIVQGSPDYLKLNLLGAAEYEVKFGVVLNGNTPELPGGAKLTSQGTDWIRYQVNQPELVNPQLLASLLGNGFPIISLQEIPRSVEQLYLQAIQAPDETEGADV